MIHALTSASEKDLLQLQNLMKENPEDKVEKVLEIFRACGIDQWAKELKESYLQKALSDLDEIAVSKVRKESLLQLANYLISRDK
jgi:geranylgeranyl diphosphate synthase type II